MVLLRQTIGPFGFPLNYPRRLGRGCAGGAGDLTGGGLQLGIGRNILGRNIWDGEEGVAQMGSLLQSTRNTRALPTGTMRSKDNLMDMLTAYALAHPEVDIEIIVPHRENMENLLKQL